MSRVLVTDGEQRAALAVVRSLGRAGYEVIVAGPRSRTLAGASRHAVAQHRLPDPLTRPAEFREALFALALAERIDVLVPVAEPAVIAVLEAAQLPSGLRIPLPPLSVFRAISDKQRLLETAPTVGIRVPLQWTLANRAAVPDPALGALTFPVVIKPARSVAGAGESRAKLAVSYARDAEELNRALAAYPDAAFPLLLQSRVDGPGVGIFLLRWEGVVRAVFAHRRIREKPPSGGVSVYRESIPADPALVACSTALLAAFDWSGVAMIEYKIEARTGTPYLMEVNGRFWGSLQLAVDAGVDFPRMLVELALGGTPAKVYRYRSGLRLRWWLGDLDHLLARLRRPAGELALPADAPTRLQTLLQVLRPWWPGDRSEILRLDDPLPALQELRDWLGRR